MPDYLSQVQEEEEVLGVQYDLEESHSSAPAPYPGPSAPASYPRPSTPASYPGSSCSVVAPSSSSVQLPVISQVSSSTHHCESSTGLLSPELAEPMEASPKMADGDAAGVTEEVKAEHSLEASSPEALEEEQPEQGKALAPITIE